MSQPRHWADRFRYLLMALALVVGLIGVPSAVAIGIAGPALASAVGTNDYPTAWENAASCGYLSWCISGNDNSPLGFGYRNCTDYAAYELNEQMGGTVSDPKFSYSTFGFTDGDAVGWKAAITDKLGASAANNTPAVGSVAWWDAASNNSYFGHVAIVTGVSYNSDGSVASITTADYNSHLDGNYATHSIYPSSGWPDDFLHVADESGIGSSGPLYQFVNSGSGWNQTDITYVNSGGAVWNVQGTPSVIWGSTVNVFVIGMNGQLLQYSLPSGGSWFPYTMSPSGMTFAGGVSAVQVGSTFEVFVTGTNGHLYQFVNSGSGWNWYDITYKDSGGTYWTVKGAPSVVWGSTINVFVAGKDGELLQYSLPSGGSWFPWTLSSNNTVTGGVSAVQVGSTFRVFATGAGGHLLQFVNSGSGWNWYDITYKDSGGTYWTVKGAPSVVWGSTINVFVAGKDGELLQYSLPSGGSWFPWTLSSNNTVGGGVGSTMVGSTFEVFAAGS